MPLGRMGRDTICQTCGIMGRDTSCKMCGAEREDLRHFLLECTVLSNERRTCKLLQRPRIEEEDRILRELLFGESEEEGDRDYEERKRTISLMWRKRLQVMKRNEVLQ